ncbi:MAG: Ig-like domain-containing protein, partial [Lachnospiraceae bacterium]|nr:Ig-like domain-containing protein [Lachnospiraceae bacterium]
EQETAEKSEERNADITESSATEESVSDSPDNSDPADDSAVTDMEYGEEDKIAVTAIEISDHEEELEVGKTLVLDAVVLPADATDATLTFRSSDTGIATVNSSGEVRGIGKGTVTIYASAGDVIVSTAISVIVLTTAISVNQNYLVLKPGSTYQLSTSVSPADAPQTVTYRSLSSDVAEVSSSGLVTARETGNTTVIVSNRDLMAAVTVIVNVSSVTAEEKNSSGTKAEGNADYATVFSAQEAERISSDVLKYAYENEKVLTVVGSGYSFTIDGARIVNYANEMSTDIELAREEKGVSFYINGGEYLCGPVTLYLEEPEGNYLYLYNESKDCYEQIFAESLDEIHITSPGRYMITSEKVRKSRIRNRNFAVGGIVALSGIAAVCLILKKKYWFW